MPTRPRAGNRVADQFGIGTRITEMRIQIRRSPASVPRGSRFSWRLQDVFASCHGPDGVVYSGTDPGRHHL